MAHLVTGYAGVEHITSADQGSFNAAFAGDGQFVMDVGSKYSASITSNNNVRVLDGDLLMYGRHIRINPNEYEDLTIQTGTAGKNRVDLICMTYEKNASDGKETAYLEVLKGTETEGTPSAPSYVNGNILDGATKNQMPLYKATIQGVVLKTLTKMFSVVSTFEKMALQYEAEFKRACQNYLNSLQIEDTLEEILENTQANQLAGALGVKELAEAVPVLRGEYTETFDGMPTGLWRVDLATAADGPEATGNAIVLCYQYALQMVCIYESTTITKIYARMGMNVSGIGGYGDWSIVYGGYELTRGNLVPSHNRCSITEGGYFIVGNMCYVSLCIKILANLAGNNFWGIVDNMPRPILSKVAVSVSNMNTGTAMAATITQTGNGTNGTITFRTKDALAVNDEYCVSGWYMLE